MFYIQQTHENGCGFACLKMMLANLRKDERWLYLSEDEEIMSYKDIIFEANKYGLSLCGFKAAEKREIEKHKSFPMIASLVQENGSLHAVVVTKIKNGCVYILDPGDKARKMPLLEFVKKWDGTGLKVENDSGDLFPYPNVEKENKKFSILASVVEVISLVCCALGLFFLNDKYSIAIPICCFSAFVILELVIRTIILKSMEKMDDAFINSQKIKKGQFKNFFLRLQEYKKESSINVVKFISAISLVIFLGFLMIINNFWNSILVFAPFCLSLFYFFFTKQKCDLEAKNVSFLESQIQEDMDEELFKNKIHTINKKAYKIGSTYLGSRYINIFVMLLLSLLIGAIENEFSLTLVAFYMVVEMTLLDQFNRIFEFPGANKNCHLSKAKLYNTIEMTNENV